MQSSLSPPFSVGMKLLFTSWTVLIVGNNLFTPGICKTMKMSSIRHLFGLGEWVGGSPPILSLFGFSEMSDNCRPPLRVFSMNTSVHYNLYKLSGLWAFQIISHSGLPWILLLNWLSFLFPARVCLLSPHLTNRFPSVSKGSIVALCHPSMQSTPWWQNSDGERWHTLPVNKRKASCFLLFIQLNHVKSFHCTGFFDFVETSPWFCPSENQ